MGNSSDPPDLDQSEARRYYVALGAWMFFSIVGLAIGLVAGVLAAFIVATGVEGLWQGGISAIWRFAGDPEHARPGGPVGLLILISFAVIAFIGANAIWYLAFVRSTYLSGITAQRLLGGAMPTARGERFRIAFGYILYLLIFFGLGIPIAILGDRSSPGQIVAAIGLNGLGIYYAVHAFTRYRHR